jgi:filamentous hemagglutinin family protein
MVNSMIKLGQKNSVAMLKKYKSIAIMLILFSLSTIFPSEAQQIVPDASLTNNTLIKSEGNISNIEDGTQLGTTLFHSFKDFSIPTGSTAYFNNTPNIQNIFSRVTGKSISNIDGLIRANGTANLFLINPNGIIFGKNARLDIGGSFLASTADSIKFDNDIEFSAKNPQSSPLLKVNIARGLEFGINPGAIKVQGAGHTIQGFDFNFPFDASRFANGLQVNPGKTLALLGGDVSIEGGILSTRNGNIEVGSVAQGNIGIKPDNNKWVFNYENKQIFRDISLSQSALVYVGSNEGVGKSINIQGREIKVLNGSLIASQTYGSKQNGETTINASNFLEVKGESQFNTSAIFTSNFGKTPGENIEVNAKNFIIEGAQIATTTFSDTPGGIVSVNANNLKIVGSTPSIINPSGLGGINTFSYSSGNGGDITAKIGELILDNRGTITAISTRSSGRSGNLNLTSESVIIRNGGSLGSLTFANGKGGNVLVSAKDFIELTGQSSSLEPSLIQANTFGSGNAGNLEINTPKLFIRDGATVNTTTVSYGNAGSLTINAFDFIEVSGVNPNSKFPSSIQSSAAILNESLRARFPSVPLAPTGDAGSVTVNTSRLNIMDSGSLSVKNDGTGDAGTLQVNANRISVASSGAITATTAVGQGGDIDINSNFLQLRDATISATAGQQGSDGDGGNVTINTKNLFSLGDSSITANAFEGRGGNIKIDTKGLFLSANSQFTASSERGVNGTVEVNFLIGNNVQPKIELEAVQTDTKIASVCQGRSDTIASTFVVSGHDGLFPSPSNLLSQNPIWQDNSLLDQSDNDLGKLKSRDQEPTQILEAQAVVQESDGRIFLTTNSGSVSANSASSANPCADEVKKVGLNQF